MNRIMHKAGRRCFELLALISIPQHIYTKSIFLFFLLQQNYVNETKHISRVFLRHFLAKLGKP